MKHEHWKSSDTGHCSIQWYWTLWHPVMLDIVESLALPDWQIIDICLVFGHMNISGNANVDKLTKKSLDFEVITHLSSMCRPAWCSSMVLCDCKSLKMLFDSVSVYDMRGFIYLYGKRVNSWSKVCSKVEGLTPSLPIPGYPPTPHPPHTTKWWIKWRELLKIPPKWLWAKIRMHMLIWLFRPIWSYYKIYWITKVTQNSTGMYTKESSEQTDSFPHWATFGFWSTFWLEWTTIWLVTTIWRHLMPILLMFNPASLSAIFRFWSIFRLIWTKINLKYLIIFSGIPTKVKCMASTSTPTWALIRHLISMFSS